MTQQKDNFSGIVKDIIIGMSDGLTVPFALTAGLSGVVSTNHLIVISGIAEITAGCISMGLGGYLAGESEVDSYNAHLRREYEHIEKVPEIELQEVEDALSSVGVERKMGREVALQISKDKNNWANFMMQMELKMQKPDFNRARKSALNIGISYLVGGFIPLFPYIITDNNKTGFYISCMVTITALIVFGYFKSRVTEQPLLRGTIKVTSIGIIAAAAAFLLSKAVS